MRTALLIFWDLGPVFADSYVTAASTKTYGKDSLGHTIRTP